MGGGGVQAQRQENILDNFFLFISPQLILQFTEGIQWFYFRENYTLPRNQRGPIFSRGGGGPTFSRGVQMLFSIETHITCEFPGGTDPLYPLWIRTCHILIYSGAKTLGHFKSVLFLDALKINRRNIIG